MTFANKIAQLRDRERLALKDVERALKDAGVEVSSSTIDRMEKGEISPRIDVAFGLAKLYGVQLDYLADDQMKTPPATAERNEDLIWLLETMDELGFKEMKSRILRPGTTGQ